MAGKDLLALCNGIRQVLTSGCSVVGANVRHCLANSSLRPFLGGPCSVQCPSEHDLNIPDVPGISDAGLGEWMEHKVSDEPVPKYSNNSNTATTDSGAINSNVRKYHTWCRYYSIDSSIEISKDNAESRQKVRWDGPCDGPWC